MPQFLKVLLLAVLVLAQGAMAQGGAFIGQTIDPEQPMPVPDIVIFLRDSAGRTFRHVVTDDRGLFVLPFARAGVYQLVFTKQCTRPLYGPVDTVSADSTVEREYKLRFEQFPQDSVFASGSLEAPATMKDTGNFPRYPSVAERDAIPGRVELEYVVDTTGRVEIKTMRILRSTRGDFTRAVIDYLPMAAYVPARVCGRHVRQRLQQVFEFKAPYP